MGLEGLRIQVLEQIRNCPNRVRVQELLSATDVRLKKGLVSAKLQQEFWAVLARELDVVAEDSPTLLDAELADALRPVLVAARTIIGDLEATARTKVGSRLSDKRR
jgi:hypothetical protein